MSKLSLTHRLRYSEHLGPAVSGSWDDPFSFLCTIIALRISLHLLNDQLLYYYVLGPCYTSFRDRSLPLFPTLLMLAGFFFLLCNSLCSRYLNTIHWRCLLPGHSLLSSLDSTMLPLVLADSLGPLDLPRLDICLPVVSLSLYLPSALWETVLLHLSLPHSLYHKRVIYLNRNPIPQETDEKFFL